MSRPLRYNAAGGMQVDHGGDNRISAAVLTGGASRRMGQDKALIDFGGETLLRRTVRLLRGLPADVEVIGWRPEYPVEADGAPVLQDHYPQGGTLGGIATALESASHEFVLVVACDMPLLSNDLLRAMMFEPRDYDALVPALAAARSKQGGDETLEMLHAIYRRTCLPSIRRRLDAGQLRAASFLDDVSVRRLPECWVRQHDPHLRSFVNVNTPDELRGALRIVGAG